MTSCTHPDVVMESADPLSFHPSSPSLGFMPYSPVDDCLSSPYTMHHPLPKFHSAVPCSSLYSDSWYCGTRDRGQRCVPGETTMPSNSPPAKYLSESCFLCCLPSLTNMVGTLVCAKHWETPESSYSPVEPRNCRQSHLKAGKFLRRLETPDAAKAVPLLQIDD